MPTPLFYQKPIALNREIHRKLKVRNVLSFAYAAGTNSVPLTGNEFASAARQLPILFVSDNKQQPSPIALLGLRRDENLFVKRMAAGPAATSRRSCAAILSYWSTPARPGT